MLSDWWEEEGRVLKDTFPLGYLQLAFIFSEGLSPLVIFSPIEKMVVRDWSRFILQHQACSRDTGIVNTYNAFKISAVIESRPSGFA